MIGVLADITESCRGRRHESRSVEVPRSALLIPRQLPIYAGHGIRPDKDSACTGSDTRGIAL